MHPQLFHLISTQSTASSSISDFMHIDKVTYELFLDLPNQPGPEIHEGMSWIDMLLTTHSMLQNFKY